MILAAEHRRPISEVQRSILRVIVTRTDSTGVQPSQAEIAAETALGQSSVHAHLLRLEASGWIDRRGARGVVVAPDVRAEIRGETIAEVVAETATEIVEETVDREVAHG